MAVVFAKTPSITAKPFHYCPGCTHGIVHRLVAEVIDEMGLAGKTIGVAPVGCSVFAYDYFNFDFMQVAHGRAPAAATGIRRTLPDAVIFAYQGDGDLASIGAAEIIHAAMRGEKITVIFINNAIYGMTGGQMAPTTLVNQKASTSGPHGRDKATYGSPLRVCEMLATIEGATFVERTSTHNVLNINRTKKAIRAAFENQINGGGFSIVEVISNCPTGWGMTPVDSLSWMEENMLEYFPLGNFRKPGEVK